MKSKNKEYIDYLYYLGKSAIEPISKYLGVCNSFKMTFNIELDQVVKDYYKIIEKFEYYSGSKDYPIKGEMDSPEEEFHNTENLWIGEYGRRRRLFCLFLSQVLERNEPLVYTQYIVGKIND